MLDYLGRKWGWIVFRGLVALLFGVLAIAWPGITLAALVIVWGAYALADGLLALIAAWRVRDQGRPFWSLLIVGLLGIAAGVVTFLWPAITALSLLMIIAVWAVAMGVFQIAAAIRLRKVIQGEWLLGLSGLASVIFGVVVIARPGAGALAVIWLIGSYAIFFGILLIALGLRLKPHAPGGRHAAA
jgi:uncharacterized membrane protein HdeD (DUF308 family)